MMATESRDPERIPEALARLTSMESHFNPTRMAALEAIRHGNPVPSHVLSEVQELLLPQCQRAAEALQALAPPPHTTSRVQALIRYVQLHEQAWQAFASALATRDMRYVQHHDQLLLAAQQAVSAPAFANSAIAASAASRFGTLLYSLTPRVWTVPVLVAANVLMWIATILDGANPFMPSSDLMINWGANFGPLTLHGEGWRVVTCMFLHFGLLHIGFNMYVFWQLGQLMERLVGNVGLLVLYMASGIAASLASLAWNLSAIPPTVSAGASGAVFGVCGGLIGFIVLRRDTIPPAIFQRLKSSLVTFVVYNVAFSFVVPQIDIAAHLGGLVYGGLCGLMLSQPLVPGAAERRWRYNLVCLAVSAIILPILFHFLTISTLPP
jgi:membrane associated rhomboid family serine protease